MLRSSDFEEFPRKERKKEETFGKKKKGKSKKKKNSLTELGCATLCAQAPSFVTKIRPVVAASSLPTVKSLGGASTTAAGAFDLPPPPEYPPPPRLPLIAAAAAALLSARRLHSASQPASRSVTSFLRLPPAATAAPDSDVQW